MRYLPLALLLVACGSDPSPSAAVDAAPPDALGLDVAVVVDAAPDTPSDASEVPDTAPDAAPDAAVVDAVGDASAADAPGDAPGDAVAVADVLRDASADAVPLDTRATAVSVVVRSSSLTWSTPRAQPTCTVTGGTLSLGVDYDRPEPKGFTVLGPIAGPVTLTMIGSAGAAMSDVRATITSGARYLTDGESVTRVNVAVRGVPWAGFSVELTALGCVVR